MPTVLVIENDPAIRSGLLDALEASGYDTLQACDGRAGLEAVARGTFDLLLLDLVLPHVDGFTDPAKLRAWRPTTPVIILSAMGAEAERVLGLNLGADDYRVKPFGASSARPRSSLARPLGAAAPSARCRRLERFPCCGPPRARPLPRGPRAGCSRPARRFPRWEPGPLLGLSLSKSM